MSLYNVFVKRILLTITLLFSFQFAFAGSGTTVIQGNPATINWNVVGGTGACDGATDYPPNADGVRTWWQTNHSSIGNHTFPAINAPAGVYTFTCTDGVASDSATLTVTSSVPTIASFTSFTFAPVSVAVGGASTLTWDTQDATSVGISCTSGPAPAQTAWNGSGLPTTPSRPDRLDRGWWWRF